MDGGAAGRAHGAGRAGRERVMAQATPLRRLLLAAALAAGAGLGLSSCYRLFSTKVAKIENNLVKYEGKVVMVYGKVKERFDLPGLKCFVVDDGSGAIGVVTQKALPRVGDTVHPKGAVRSGFKLGKRTLLVLLEAAPPPQPTPKPPPPGGAPS